MINAAGKRSQTVSKRLFMTRQLQCIRPPVAGFTPSERKTFASKPTQQGENDKVVPEKQTNTHP